MRYQFIEAHQEEYPMGVLCEALVVSMSGYYDWRKRPMSQHAQSDAQLAEQIRAIYQANRRLYGSPRVHAELQEQGITCARKRVARLMREQGLAARRPRHRTVTTAFVTHQRAWPPTASIASSLPSTPTRSGPAILPRFGRDMRWLYLALILDLFSRRVVG